MEGYLLKQSPAGLKPWQKRYFVLSGGDLLYFKAPPSASTESKGAIALLSALKWYVCVSTALFWTFVLNVQCILGVCPAKQ